MNKKSDDEFGILITREMKSMMLDASLTYEQRAQLFCAIIAGEKLDNPLLKAFADSLKVGYISTNNKRKAEILSRRERQRKYQHNLRTSTANVVDECLSASENVDERASLNKAKQSKAKHNNIPLPPKGGKGDNDSLPEGRCVWCDKEGYCQDPTSNCAGAKCCNCCGNTQADLWATYFADGMLEWYPHKINRTALTKILISKAKKNLARAIVDGVKRWRESGAWAEPRFVPPDFVKWIKLERFLDQPPEKNSAARDDSPRTAGESDLSKADDTEDGM